MKWQREKIKLNDYKNKPLQISRKREWQCCFAWTNTEMCQGVSGCQAHNFASSDKEGIGNGIPVLHFQQ